MKIQVSNLKKPDNKKWKQIADIALYSLPLLTTVVLTTPLTDTTQKWILTILNIAIVGFKTLSKFTYEEVSSDINNTSSTI